MKRLGYNKTYDDAKEIFDVIKKAEKNNPATLDDFLTDKDDNDLKKINYGLPLENPCGWHISFLYAKLSILKNENKQLYAQLVNYMKDNSLIKESEKNE